MFHLQHISTITLIAESASKQKAKTKLAEVARAKASPKVHFCLVHRAVSAKSTESRAFLNFMRSQDHWQSNNSYELVHRNAQIGR